MLTLNAANDDGSHENVMLVERVRDVPIEPLNLSHLVAQDDHAFLERNGFDVPLYELLQVLQ